MANSEDPDEMPHNAVFHQCLQCLPRKTRFSEKEIYIPVERNTIMSDTCVIRHLGLLCFADHMHN